MTAEYLRTRSVAPRLDRLLGRAAADAMTGMVTMTAMTAMAAKAQVVRVAHRFPLRAAPHRDPGAYLLSPANLLTRRPGAFHPLRRRIKRQVGDSGMLLVVSARHAEGRSIAALSLSLGFAQGSARAVYVEADFRRPALHTFFDIPAGAGAADVLWGRQPMSAVSACILATDLPGLFLLPAGARPGSPDASKPPDASRLHEFCAQLRSAGDWIIIDCPPLLSYDDALPLLGLVDGVVIVTLEGRTRDDDLKELSAQLALAKARILGKLTLEP